MSETAEKKRPFPENKVLRNWILALGGPKRCAAIWGTDESTVWRWTVGEFETPKWVLEYMKISEKNAKVKQENSCKNREIDRLNSEIRELNLTIKRLKDESRK